MADLCGEPMLAFMLKRLGSLVLDDITVVVATSNLARDDEIQSLCQDRGIDCYCGSEQDVLSRFRDIAEHLDADVIVRLTGDSPLVWAGLVRYALSHHASYFTWVDAPDGMDVEVLSRDALDDATDSEHVTFGLHGKGKKIPFPKLSVDVPEDLERVKQFLSGR